MRVTFGQKVKDERTRLELTRKQLAGILKTTSSTVARWERGEVTPWPLVQNCVLVVLGLIATKN